MIRRPPALPQLFGDEIVEGTPEERVRWTRDQLSRDLERLGLPGLAWAPHRQRPGDGSFAWICRAGAESLDWTWGPFEMVRAVWLGVDRYELPRAAFFKRNRDVPRLWWTQRPGLDGVDLTAWTTNDQPGPTIRALRPEVLPRWPLPLRLQDGRLLEVKLPQGSTFMPTGWTNPEVLSLTEDCSTPGTYRVVARQRLHLEGGTTVLPRDFRGCVAIMGAGAAGPRLVAVRVVYRGELRGPPPLEVRAAVRTALRRTLGHSFGSCNWPDRSAALFDHIRHAGRRLAPEVPRLQLESLLSWHPLGLRNALARRALGQAGAEELTRAVPLLDRPHTPSSAADPPRGALGVNAEDGTEGPRVDERPMDAVER